MSFRRTGHSDERRRRVLMDDGSATSEATTPTKRPREKNAKTKNYSDAALVANQAPVTAVIATRPWTLSVLMLSAITFIALLNLLHGEIPRLAALAGSQHVSGLKLHTTGNLAAWFSGALLAWAAVMSMQVYNLRRHRVDDYKARYRVWIWTTVVLALASIDAVSGLHRALGGAMANLSGRGTLNVDLCWLAVATTLLSFICLRMGIEMRRSIGALTTLMLGLACYAVVAAFQLQWLKLPKELAQQASGTAALFGHLLVWYTTLIYARYVYLDAQGLLALPKPPREKAVKKVKEAEAKVDAKAEAATADKPVEKTIAGKQVRIDAAHTGGETTKQPAAAAGGPLKAAMISSATTKTPVAANSAAAAATEARNKLSKADRKRLRREGKLGDDEEDE
ncbi:MAG TPA: hypothetical protein VL096_21465 [Pirellulaceae bacterium]|nr:hypothetical protein [Pirellulaceae bacterium]